MRTFVLYLITAFLTVAHAQTVGTVTLDISVALDQMFGMPPVSVLAQAFSIGLSTPLTVYLVAYCVGCLVNFWRN